MNATRSLRRTVLACWIGLAMAGPASAAAVIDWNTTYDTVSPTVGPPPNRAYLGALVHIAIHDALNNIRPRYETYTVRRPAAAYASPDAAIAAAARDVLVARLGCLPVPAPARAAACALVASQYDATLAAVPAGPAKDTGILAGQHAAHDILVLRTGDGEELPDPPYLLVAGKGVYQPTAPNFPVPAEEAFGKVKPFAMRSPSQFRAKPGEIFDLTSAAYARDFNEVKTVGALATRAAAPDSPQTDIARFWPAGGANWNAVARTIIANRGLSDPWKQARLLALDRIAETDGLIQVFDTKYAYTFWRPVTAIRWPGSDGNAATTPDPDWLPLFSFPGPWSTPPYPDYTCGLPTASGANSEVLRQFFGTDNLAYSLTVALPELRSPPAPSPFPGGYLLPGKTITRSYATLSQAANESASARVYAGIHFRSGCKLGITKGEQVGRFVVQHVLRPLP
jgi:hypothetical protein